MGEGSAGNLAAIQRFRPVLPAVFDERAKRLQSLASGHAMQDYLRFATALVRAQHEQLRVFPVVPIPESATLAHCREHGLPPLSVHSHPRHPAWRDALAQLRCGLDQSVLPPRAASVIESLAEASEAALEQDAGNLLAGNYGEIDPGRAPFIAAALQVYWVRMALTLAETGFDPAVQNGLCPMCGSQPVASVVRIGAAQGLRYLTCSLCASEWHVVRIKCSACASTKGISYLMIEGGSDAVKAECCDECNVYLKIIYLEKDVRMEPYADDLATLALDMLVDEKGYKRLGPNLLFLPGRPTGDR